MHNFNIAKICKFPLENYLNIYICANYLEKFNIYFKI